MVIQQLPFLGWNRYVIAGHYVVIGYIVAVYHPPMKIPESLMRSKQYEFYCENAERPGGWYLLSLRGILMANENAKEIFSKLKLSGHLH